MFGSFKELVHSSSKPTLCAKLFVFFYHYSLNACGSVVTPPVFLDIGTCVSSFTLFNFQEGCCPHLKLPHIGLRGLIELYNISSPHLSFLWPEKRDFFQSLSVVPGTTFHYQIVQGSKPGNMEGKKNTRSLQVYEVILQVLISSPVCYLLFRIPPRFVLCIMSKAVIVTSGR